MGHFPWSLNDPTQPWPHPGGGPHLGDVGLIFPRHRRWTWKTSTRQKRSWSASRKNLRRFFETPVGHVTCGLVCFRCGQKKDCWNVGFWTLELVGEISVQFVFLFKCTKFLKHQLWVENFKDSTIVERDWGRKLYTWTSFELHLEWRDIVFSF